MSRRSETRYNPAAAPVYSQNEAARPRRRPSNPWFLAGSDQNDFAKRLTRLLRSQGVEMVKKAASRSGQAEPAPDSPQAVIQRLRKESQTLHSILELLGHVTEQETVDDICRSIVEGVRQYLGFDRAGLFLWDDRTRSFRGTFGTDMDGHTVDEHDLFWYGDGWAPTAQIDQGAVFIRGEKLDQPPARPGEEDVRAELVVLRLPERVYGILSVDNRLSRRPITIDDLRPLTLFSRILGNAVEISRARTELEQSAERFRQVAENSREWIWEMNADGRYTYASPVVRDILGYGPEEVAGRSYLDLIVEGEKDRVREAMNRATAERCPVLRLINRQKAKSGQEVVFETSCLPVLDASRQLRGFRGANRDVTLQVEMEERLRQAQKMEAIGRLAGGIAHYFNNLLTLIMGASGMLIEQLADNDPVRKDLEQIRQAGEQAASLTRQLMAFSSRQVLHVKRTDVNAVLRDIEKLLTRTLGEEIRMSLQLEPGLPEVEADEDRLKYVILHLVINARGAMMETMERIRLSPISGVGEWAVKPRDGRHELILWTSRVEVGKAECAQRPHLLPGPHVLIAIRDTGVGMPEQVRQHLFEPFFTTKEVGQGAGLGLSSIYGTMKQMGGDIQVESELGKGTTFRLCLPAVVAPPGTRQEGAAMSEQRTPTILVVEDEEAVREFTVRMLKTLKYNVLSASNGEQALALFRAPEQTVDLVISDMVMPNMTGREFVEKLHEVKKDMRVLFVSGYAPEEAVGGEALGPGISFLMKPYTREPLAKKIREMLEGKV